MRALVISCTLKRSPEPSNTEELAQVMIEALRAADVDIDTVRAVDHYIAPGVSSDEGGEANPVPASTG